MLYFLRFGVLVVLFFRIVTRLARARRPTGKPVLVDRRTFFAHVSRSKSQEVTGVQIALETNDRFRFVLRGETRLDAFAKNFGIAREWQTGDFGFDERVFIVSEDWALNEALSSNRDLRALFDEMLTRKGAVIESSRGRLHVEFTPEPGSRDSEDEFLRVLFSRELAPGLLRLEDALGRIQVGDPPAMRDPAMRRATWLSAVSIVLGILGIAGFIYDVSVDDTQVVREAIPRYASWAALAAGGALLATSFLWLRATPRSHGVLLDILLAAIPGTWFAASGALAWHNQAHDAAPAEHRTVQIAELAKRKSKNTMKYYLTVNAWPDPRGVRIVRIREREFAWMEQGACLTVIWHPGRLGDGWVSGFERSDATSCDEVER